MRADPVVDITMLMEPSDVSLQVCGRYFNPKRPPLAADSFLAQTSRSIPQEYDKEWRRNAATYHLAAALKNYPARNKPILKIQKCPFLFSVQTIL